MVVNDKFGNFGWTHILRTKTSQTIKDSFESIIMSYKRKQNSFETDRGKELSNSIFQKVLKINKTNFYSRGTSLTAGFAEFNRTIRDFLEKVVFLKGDANWIDVLPVIAR